MVASFLIFIARQKADLIKATMAANALALATALATAAAAMSSADAPDQTTDQILEEMATATRNAADHGTVPGTRAAIDRMKRKWCRFVTQFGVGLGYVSGASPSLQFFRNFAAYMHKHRDRWSAAERMGLGYSAFCSAAYHLAMYVFPELGLEGWVDLDPVVLKMKGAPFRITMLGERKRLVVGNGDLRSTEKSLRKSGGAAFCRTLLRTALWKIR